MIEAFLRPLLGRVRERGLEAERNPGRAQARVHRRLARGLVGTRAGALQPLAAYEDLERYRRRVRLTGYEDYARLVREAIARPRGGGFFERGETWGFGHTSSLKYIPYTRAHLASFRAFQLEAAAEIGFGLGEASVFSGSSFMIQGNLETHRAPSGARLGYSSAVMVDETPWLLKRRLRPRLEDLRSPELDERVRLIGEALLAARPRVLVGIPEYVAAVLGRLARGPRAEEVREALSGVTVYGWSGSPLGPARERLEPLFSPRCAWVDAVSATEGALGLRCRETGAYRFAWDRSLLLFTPVGAPERRFFAWELEPGQDYEVVLGSDAGLLGYRLGDRIRRARCAPLRFELLPRARGLGLSEPETRALGDYYLYLDPRDRRLELAIEAAPDASLIEALATRLGAGRVRVRLLGAGRISDAALRASAQAGLTKLPRSHQDPRLHTVMEKFLA